MSSMAVAFCQQIRNHWYLSGHAKARCCDRARQAGQFGGRRLLVKQKRLAKTAPVPCVMRDPSITIDIYADDGCSNSSCRSR
jgi:hypothetical protein